jgi:hypothetical protein
MKVISKETGRVYRVLAVFTDRRAFKKFNYHTGRINTEFRTETMYKATCEDYLRAEDRARGVVDKNDPGMYILFAKNMRSFNEDLLR